MLDGMLPIWQRRVMQHDHPLKLYREAQDPKLTTADLARLLEVGRSTVHRWESGNRKPDVHLLPRITERTGIPARELRPDLIGLADQLAGAAQ